MNPEKLVKYSVPVFTFAIVSRSIEEISFVYYAVPVLCVFFIILVLSGEQPSSLVARQTGLQVNEGTLTSKITPLLFLLPGIWFLLTSLWSSHPEISAARALYFILISTGCLSVGFLWMRYSDSDKSIFDFLLPVNILLTALCLFSIVSGIPADSWTAGHGKGFIGFFGHQNLLASVLLFTIPAVFYRVVILAKSRIRAVITPDSRRTSFAGMTGQAGMTDEDAPSFRTNPKSDGITNTSHTIIRHPESSILVFIAGCLLLTTNLLLLTLTYSRSAILSLLTGIIVFLLSNKNWKILSYSFIITAVLAIIIYLTPSLNQFADKIIKKDFPDFYSSRIWMWEPSYKAALEGGIFGLGYGISHPEIRSSEYSDRFENGRLIREKGNSSLALIEEAGLIGLVLFLIPIFLLLFKSGYTRHLMSDENNLSSIRNPVSTSSLHYDKTSSIGHPASSILIHTPYSLLSSALAAFLIHAQFEAWWVGVGSVQLPLFLVYIGLLIGYQQIRSQ